MINFNKIILFSVLGAALFSAFYLLFSTTGLDVRFIQTFRDFFSNIFNSENQVALFQVSTDYPKWDTKLIVYRTDIHPNGEFQYYSIFYLNYLPMLLFFSIGLAAVLVSPKSLKRNLIGFAIGGLLMLGFSTFLIRVIVRNLIFKIKQIAGVDFSQFMYEFNDKIFSIFIEDGFEWLLVFPFVFLFLTTIRLKDFGINLLGKNDTKRKVEPPKEKKTRAQRVEEKRAKKRKK